MDPEMIAAPFATIGAAVAVALLAAGAASGAPSAPVVPPGAEIVAHGIVGRATPACQSCHGGPQGRPINARTPRIAGLNADYLERQLGLFGQGLRNNLAMMQVARSLSADDRTALARYLAEQPFATPPLRARASEADIALGRRLAQTGRWGVNVPPCASCHGADGMGVGAVSPALAGQSAAYIEAQLVNWSDGDRKGDPLGLMTGIAKALSPKDRKAVAAYYGTLASRRPTSQAPARVSR
jgi:cytochrome c553